MKKSLFVIFGGMLATGSYLLAKRYYPISEALVFVAGTALLVFAGMSLWLVGVVLNEVGRAAVRWVRRRRRTIALQAPALPKARVGQLASSSVTGKAEGTGSF